MTDHVNNQTFKSTLSALMMLSGLLVAPQTLAHASLTEREATAGSTARLAMSINHGCAGEATHTVRIQIPDGVVGVRPMPKPGWTVEIVTETLDEPYEDHGDTITEGVSELRWSGGDLDDAHYDEFVFQATLPDTPDETLYFRTVQECEADTLRWIEVPTNDDASPSGDYPAPVLELVAPDPEDPDGHGHDHHHH